MSTKKTVFIDLDGVIVDLLGQLKNEIASSEVVYEDETDLIDVSETIFLNVPPNFTCN